MFKMSAKEHRAAARAALSGSWGVAIGAGLVATAIIGGGGGGGFSFSFPTSFETESVNMSNEEAVKFVLIALALFAVVFIGAYLIAGAYGMFSSIIQAGYCFFNLKLVDDEVPAFRNLFSQFRKAKAIIIAYLLRFLFQTVGYMLFIVPGIIVSYNYALVPFILADNPCVSGKEALKMSREMMYGNRWRLFCLQFSFIGWILLTILSLGIGSIWLTPYQNAALASFYRELFPAKIEESPEEITE